MSTPLFHTAELLHSQDSLSVQWRSAPGEVPRPVEVATQERIAQQLKALAEAESTQAMLPGWSLPLEGYCTLHRVRVLPLMFDRTLLDCMVPCRT